MSELIILSLNTFTNYIGVRGVLAILVISTLCWKVLNEGVIPSDFYSIVTLLLGFYFGRQEHRKHNGD